MTNKVRFRYNSGVQYDLRRHPKLVTALEDYGQGIVDDANQTLEEGEGYRMSSRQGKKNPQGRWAVRIYTASRHARNSNARHNTLVRLLSSRGRI